MLLVERYKQNRWFISRVSGRAMHRFAVWYVLFAAAEVQRKKFSTEHRTVVRNAYRVRRLWFNRAKALMSAGLWQPGNNYTVASGDMTARRCLYCRPSFVFFRGGNEKKCRPCKHVRFCPFCWARSAAYTYWQTRRELKAAPETHLVSCVVQKHVLKAAGLNQHTLMAPKDLVVNVQNLKDIIEQHIQAYERVAKQLQRKTTGSMWAVVVNPTARGWRIETRQYFLAPAGTTLPVVKLQGAKLVYAKSRVCKKPVGTGKLLGRFVRYPPGLLKSYTELTAVYLQATYNLRLRRGTGVLRACSTGLHLKFKATVKGRAAPTTAVTEDVTYEHRRAEPGSEQRPENAQPVENV